MSRYKLPPLPYDYAALEPYISGKILELHHGKHHKAYVDHANRAIEELQEARRKRDFARLPLLQHRLQFNVSGHVLHSIFWQNMTPDGGGAPAGELAAAIQRDFGGFDLMKEQLVQAALTITGSGWAALVYDPLLGRLGTTQIHDHQSEVTQGGVPLLVIDAWEHAYYLQYHNDKGRFFEALFHVWNWDDVARRFEAAQRLDLLLVDAAEAEIRPSPEAYAPH